MLVSVEAFGPAAEVQDHVTRRIELHDGVGPLVDDPQIVLVVEADRVAVAEPVDPLPDFAHEVALVVELEQVGRRVAVQRTAGGGARVVQQDDVALGVLRHTKRFAQIHGRRVLQEVRHRHIRNLRRVLLGENGGRQQHEDDRRRDRDETFHRNLLDKLAGRPGTDRRRHRTQPANDSALCPVSRRVGAFLATTRPIPAGRSEFFLRTPVRGQHTLAETDVAGGHFDQFVVVDEFDRLFQTEQTRGHEAQRVVRR